MKTANPFSSWSAPPSYRETSAARFRAALETELPALAEELDRLEGTEERSWRALVVPLIRFDLRLSHLTEFPEHLLRVRHDDALAGALRQARAAISALSTRRRQSLALRAALLEAREAAGLDEVQRASLALMLRAIESTGVGLGPRKKERLRAIEEELGQLKADFSRNLRASRARWDLVLNDPELVRGLNRADRHAAAASARAAGHDRATGESGPWRVTADDVSARPVLRRAEDRGLREQVWRAWSSRACEKPHDNAEVFTRALALRRERARLLGFRDHMRRALVGRVAPSVEAVEAFCDALYGDIRPALEAERADLERLARAAGQLQDGEALAPWDVWYLQERAREQRHGLNDEEVRAYFPLPRVLEGLFGLCERLRRNLGLERWRVRGVARRHAELRGPRGGPPRRDALSRSLGAARPEDVRRVVLRARLAGARTRERHFASRPVGLHRVQFRYAGRRRARAAQRRRGAHPLS